MKLLFALFASILFLAFSACAKKSGEVVVDHHTHHAPHGGTLVELGEHNYALELVHDATTGTLTAYILDGHAENFIRLPDRSFDALVKPAPAATPTRLTLSAVANTATGETVGNTSQFSVTADLLKTTAALEVGIPSLTVRGLALQDIRAQIPAK